MYVYLNNQFIEADKATLHISDLAIQRGYGIFDFFRVRNHVLLYVEDHLDRFFNSSSIMKLPSPYPREKLLSILHELVAMNSLPSSGIRIMLTGGYSSDGYQLATPNLIIMQNPLTQEDLVTPQTASIITHEFVRELPEAKTINYTTGIWLQQKIKEEKADDVLYHINGRVTEFPRSNFFIVTQDDVLITPEKNVLKGITRKNVLECASTMFQVKETAVTLDDIKRAKEAFLTSSTKRAQSIITMDGVTIGEGKPGAMTNSILKMLNEKEEIYIRERS